MNILFLTLLSFDSLKERNIYTDLLREFIKNGHEVYSVSPVEKRNRVATHLVKENHASILRLRIGNMQKTNRLEKGISMMMIEPSVIRAIKKYYSNVKFDLVLYSTPPITLVSAIDFVKKRDGARTYLLLKDIFPQNAVDIGMLSETGLKGMIYRHFRKQEKRLYSISDRIGCMSPANVDYVIKHNPELNPEIVEVCPNSVEVIDKSVDEGTRNQIREKYDIPLDKKVFVYGGNLGKPQGIPFLIECLKRCQEIEDSFFLIVGDGTDYHLLKEYVESIQPNNVKLMKRLPKEDYDTLVGACDIGMIFLDYRFTIPNFPSRLLSYMGAKLPVLAVTDQNTDVGKVIVDGGFGWQCESNNSEEFRNCIERLICLPTKQMGSIGFDYMNKYYCSKKVFEIIMEK